MLPSKVASMQLKFCYGISTLLCKRSGQCNLWRHQTCRTTMQRHHLVSTSAPTINMNDRDKQPYPFVTVTRLVMPQDIQLLGVIHGGILLKWIEEAGDIVANKFCNRYAAADSKHGGHTKTNEESQPVVAVLASSDNVDFIHAVKLGEKAELHAEVTFTSSRSLQVVVNVWATNVRKRQEPRLCTHAILWYVPIAIHLPDHPVVPVPQLKVTNSETHEQARLSYEARARQRVRVPIETIDSDGKAYWMMSGHRSAASSSFIIHPSHCGGTFCKGGVFLKWMDEISGCLAMSHCLMPCVTASIDSVEFTAKVRVGSYVTIAARPVFSGNRSLDVYTSAYIEHLDGERVEYERVATAFFTFSVYKSLSEIGDGTFVPQIDAKTEEDKKVFEMRRKRHDEKKAARLLAASKKQKQS